MDDQFKSRERLVKELEQARKDLHDERGNWQLFLYIFLPVNVLYILTVGIGSLCTFCLYYGGSPKTFQLFTPIVLVLLGLSGVHSLYILFQCWVIQRYTVNRSPKLVRPKPLLSKMTPGQLTTELHRAVINEDYDRAAQIRNLLSKTS